MAKSFANGDYRLIMAVESASRPDSWYRILQDKETQTLSCDCPAWTFRADPTQGNSRSCIHTRLAEPYLAQGTRNTQTFSMNRDDAYIAATRNQWPGLDGSWGITNTTLRSDGKFFNFYQLHLETGNGDAVRGMVAFSGRHRHTADYVASRIAGWAGYALAAEVARLNHFPMAGQPPEHFKVSATRRRTASGRAGIGLGDILRLGDQLDLGDGLQPVQRAENTLQLFLGDILYAQLERQHFLDVSSVCFANQKRVYRVRRDPNKLRERRVRVFENGVYKKDFCIVRHQDVPEGDHWLTVFLSLISDEMRAISVVQDYNIFSPYSDDYTREKEVIPALWQPRQTVA